MKSQKWHKTGLHLLLLVVYFFIPQIIFAQVVVNEISPTSDTEWIEFYNASSSAEYLKTYFIDDDTSFTSDTGSSGKKSLSNIILSNTQFPVWESTSSLFNNTGDSVVLFDTSGTIIDQYVYDKKIPEDKSFGRAPDSSGSFSFLTNTTKGGANAPIQVNPSPTPKPTSSLKTETSSKPSIKPTPSQTGETFGIDDEPTTIEEVADNEDITDASIVAVTVDPQLKRTSFSPSPAASPLIAGAQTNQKFYAGIGLIIIFAGGLFLIGGGVLIYKILHTA